MMKEIGKVIQTKQIEDGQCKKGKSEEKLFLPAAGIGEQQEQTEGHLCHSQLIEPGTLDGNKIKKNKQKNSCQKQGSLYPFQIGSRFSEDTV